MIRVALLLLMAGCAAPATAPPPGAAGSGAPPMALIEGPLVPPPANDIPEAQRRAWFDAQRPRAEPLRPPVTERIVVREREPVRRVRSYDRYDGWHLPISLSLGWWGGRGHRGSRWGLGWNWGWRNGWCW